jgi:hypothetical protein
MYSWKNTTGSFSDVGPSEIDVRFTPAGSTGRRNTGIKSLGLPSRVSGQATWRSIVPIDLP